MSDQRLIRVLHKHYGLRSFHDLAAAQFFLRGGFMRETGWPGNFKLIFDLLLLDPADWSFLTEFIGYCLGPFEFFILASSNDVERCGGHIARFFLMNFCMVFAFYPML